jgi:hypothetical protein
MESHSVLSYMLIKQNFPHLEVLKDTLLLQDVPIFHLILEMEMVLEEDKLLAGFLLYVIFSLILAYFNIGI